MPTRKICGRHNSTADAIKEQLRGVEERFKAVEALNAGLSKGLDSGIDPDFSWDQIKARGRDVG